TLLIGVNNEYRGRSTAEYAKEFGQLLQQAIRFAGGDRNTFVLSIPDWSVTPFARDNLPDKLGRDRTMVAREIDAFNAIARQIAERCQVGFIDITEHTRAVGLLTPETTETSSLCAPASKVSSSLEADGGAVLHGNGAWLAADGLHPSGREYRWWAGLLAERIRERIAASTS
ncbi:MAG TPA: hypothetical protein VE035_14635, partial [Puia sp.]|nr:hypothetical protein [Puia sp.]